MTRKHLRSAFIMAALSSAFLSAGLMVNILLHILEPGEQDNYQVRSTPTNTRTLPDTKLLQAIADRLKKL